MTEFLKFLLGFTAMLFIMGGVGGMEYGNILPSLLYVLVGFCFVGFVVLINAFEGR